MFGAINDDFDPEDPELVEMAKRMSGHIATIISMLTSEGMNILKASLINDQFLSNAQLYKNISDITSLNELEMVVEADVANDGNITPEKILAAIVENDGLSLDIKIVCRNFDMADVAVFSSMLTGEYQDNNNWSIDAEECLENMIKADIPSLTQQRNPEGVQEIIRKEVLKLLQAR